MFFDATPKPAAAAAGGGDKFADTLLQQSELETQVPQNLSQNQKKSKYFRVETKSIIEPYVVRDHSWTLPENDESNEAAYKDDAPDGYKENMEFTPIGYNKPLAKKAAAKATTAQTKATPKGKAAAPASPAKANAAPLKAAEEPKKKLSKAQKDAMPSGPFGAIAKQMKKEPEAPAKADAKSEIDGGAKSEAKAEETKAKAKDFTPI